MKKSHYTYYSYEEFGRGYIGKRSCPCKPEEDVDYFGSYKDKTFEPTQKIILDTYDTVDEALEDEIKIQRFFQVVPNPHFANQVYQTSTKFACYKLTSEQKEKHVNAIREWQETITPEKRSEMIRKGWEKIPPDQRSKRGKKASSCLTTEQRRELGRNIQAKRTSEQRKQNAIKASRSLSSEQRAELARKNNSQRWQCTITDYITSAGGLSCYQKARGIDTSNRVRIS
jgi:hypothetical protein